jgi:hypothetical protein
MTGEREILRQPSSRSRAVRFTFIDAEKTLVPNLSETTSPGTSSKVKQFLRGCHGGLGVPANRSDFLATVDCALFLVTPSRHAVNGLPLVEVVQRIRSDFGIVAGLVRPPLLRWYQSI